MHSGTEPCNITSFLSNVCAIKYGLTKVCEKTDIS